MGAKADLERELAYAKARIEMLEEQLKTAFSDKEVLVKQIEKLQDSLISIRAPEAYRDQLFAKEKPRAPMSEEALERNRITKEVTERYFAAMEGQILTGENIDDLITTGIIRDTDPTPASLHGNNES